MGEEFFINKRKVLFEKYLFLFDSEKFDNKLKQNFEQISILNPTTIEANQLRIDIREWTNFFSKLINECENNVENELLNEIDFTSFRKIITSIELYDNLCNYVNEEKIFREAYFPANLILCINSLTNNRKNIVIKLQ